MHFSSRYMFNAYYAIVSGSFSACRIPNVFSFFGGNARIFPNVVGAQSWECPGSGVSSKVARWDGVFRCGHVVRSYVFPIRFQIHVFSIRWGGVDWEDGLVRGIDIYMSTYFSDHVCIQGLSRRFSGGVQLGWKFSTN